MAVQSTSSYSERFVFCSANLSNFSPYDQTMRGRPIHRTCADHHHHRSAHVLSTDSPDQVGLLGLVLCSLTNRGRPGGNSVGPHRSPEPRGRSGGGSPPSPGSELLSRWTVQTNERTNRNTASRSAQLNFALMLLMSHIRVTESAAYNGL